MIGWPFQFFASIGNLTAGPIADAIYFIEQNPDPSIWTAEETAAIGLTFASVSAPAPALQGTRSALIPAFPMEGRNAGLYSFPAVPPRSFAADYPNGAVTDATGRLLADRWGQPIDPDAFIIGRGMVDGGTRAITPAQLDATAAGAIGVPPAAVAAGALPRGSVGAYGVDPNGPGGVVRSIRYLDTLPPEPAWQVTVHEFGHMIDDLVGRLVGFDSAGPVRTLPTDGIRTQLRQLYHDGNDNGVRRRVVRPGLQTSPQTQGHGAGLASDRELWAEAFRAYLTNPDYMHTVAPDVARRISAAVAANPQLSQMIHFNTGGIPADWLIDGTFVDNTDGAAGTYTTGQSFGSGAFTTGRTF